MNHKMIL